MNNVAPLETVLEIFLITYNRSACVDNTLMQLKDSPFAKCRFTVLDNCSTDTTPEITAKHHENFPDYHVIRHPRNIGGDYNFLRAIELSKSRYTWILCDDDNYDFTNAQDAIAAIESCMYDHIYVASRSSVQLGWNCFGEVRAQQLIIEGARFHRACAFWPSLIFRTEWYDVGCFAPAPHLFPSFRFINKILIHNHMIYVAEHQIVIRGEACTSEQSPLILYKEWVENAALIEDHKLRRYVIEQWTEKGFMRTLSFWIAVDRAKRAKGYWKRLVDILFALTPLQKLKFLTMLPVMIIPLPMSFLVYARKLLFKMMGHKDVKNLPPIFEEMR
jgi:glycosyltransferase involved in cell wall biosynthesis